MFEFLQLSKKKVSSLFHLLSKKKEELTAIKIQALRFKMRPSLFTRSSFTELYQFK